MSERWRELFDEARQENGRDHPGRADELIELAIREAEDLVPGTRPYSNAHAALALWFWHRDQFARAEQHQRRYIEAEKQLGIGERELGNITLTLGELLQQQQKFPQARQAIEESLRIFPHERVVERAEAYRQLAVTLRELRDVPGAAKAEEKAAALDAEWQAFIGRRHP